jgi:predicted RNA-binding Zn-ribbon protein involved in translation (DUF1610 family)
MEMMNMFSLDSYRQKLESNHGGNIFTHDTLKEIDQYGLYETPFLDQEPIYKKYIYFRPDGAYHTRTGFAYLYNDGTGVIVSRGYERDIIAPVQNRLMVKFYRFGCEHEYRETNKSRGFEHNYRCAKCGYDYWVDSSD